MLTEFQFDKLMSMLRLQTQYLRELAHPDRDTTPPPAPDREAKMDSLIRVLLHYASLRQSKLPVDLREHILELADDLGYEHDILPF